MHVEVRRNQDVVILDLSGKLTAGLGDQILHDTIDELLAEEWRKILVNLTAVTFIDSAGVGELVSGHRTAQRLGADLRLLSSASERVRATFYIARLLPIFKVYESEDQALAAFAEA